MKKNILSVGLAGLALMLSITLVSAHAKVKPSQAGVGSFQTFTMGVPNEKDIPTVSVRLIIPEGLEMVTPNVKPGWRISTKTIKPDPSSEEVKVTEIDWVGGSIPAGFRDDFVFSAKVPAKETTLQWKAYQTYSDGTIVSWDQAPVANMTDAQREEMEKTGKGPYSETQIVNDLAATPTPKTGSGSSGGSGLAVSALVVSLLSLGWQFIKRG